VREIVNGGVFYDQPGVSERYAAHRHGGSRSPNVVMEEPAFLSEVGSVAGLRILDLGCGDASFGRLAIDAGCASYLGVDGSQAMLAQAQERLAGTEAKVLLGDLAEFDAEFDAEFNSAPDRFDLIVSRMALHYLADLGPTLAACRRSLAPGGRLVITVVHPVLSAPKTVETSNLRTNWSLDDYFVAGPRQRAWFGSTVTWFHRTAETYVREFVGAGFRLTSFQECEPVEARFEGDVSELERRRRVPMFLLLAGDVPS
jgi:SAM-dependent methyltransferase